MTPAGGFARRRHGICASARSILNSSLIGAPSRTVASITKRCRNDGHDHSHQSRCTNLPVSGMRLARRIQEGNESGYGAANSRSIHRDTWSKELLFLFFFSFFFHENGSFRKAAVALSVDGSVEASSTLFASPPRWLSVCTEAGIGATIKRVIYVRDGRSGGVGRPPRYLQVHTRSSRCAEISPINRSVIFGLLETSRQYADGCASYR